MQRNEIISLLNDAAARAFLAEHLNHSPEILALQHSGKVAFDLKTATQLLQLYHKAQKKIPSWVSALCAMDAKSYEQCTSERVALFKAGLCSGALLLDLSCGLGVDATHFASRFTKVIAVEKNTDLAEMFRFNAIRMGLNNVEIAIGDGSHPEIHLEKQPDVVYLDPDRRPDADVRAFLPHELEPNIDHLLEKLLDCAKLVLVKMSPLLDIQFLIKNYPKLHDIWVISELNEVKEVLLAFKPAPGKPEIHAVDLGAHLPKTYSGRLSTDYQPELPATTDFKFLFEPSKSLIKSGLHAAYCRDAGLKPLVSQGLFYAGNHNLPESMGRSFEVIEQSEINWKKLKAGLKAKGIDKISVAKRNFPESTEVIRRRLNLPDGGEYMMLFSDTSMGHRAFLVRLQKGF